MSSTYPQVLEMLELTPPLSNGLDIQIALKNEIQHSVSEITCVDRSCDYVGGQDKIQ